MQTHVFLLTFRFEHSTHKNEYAQMKCPQQMTATFNIDTRQALYI
jgi:hypothetical protein